MLVPQKLENIQVIFSPVVKGNLWGTNYTAAYGAIKSLHFFQLDIFMLNIVNRRNDFAFYLANKKLLYFADSTDAFSKSFLYQSMHRKDIFRIFCYFDSGDMFGRLFLLHQPSWPFIDIIFKYYVHF